jgi:hypothetical protein
LSKLRKKITDKKNKTCNYLKEVAKEPVAERKKLALLKKVEPKQKRLLQKLLLLNIKIVGN